MSSLERLQVKGDSGWSLARTFYIRRAFRIYPLSIVTILLCVAFAVPPSVVHLVWTAPVVPTLPTVLRNLALVQNVFPAPNFLGVLWSLPLEVQMYVLLPLCFIVARKSGRWMAGMVCAFITLGLAVRYAPLPGLWHLGVFTFGPCFAGGVIAYHLLRRTKPKFQAWIWPVALITTAALFLCCAPDAGHPERGWLACLALGCAIPFFRNSPSNSITILTHRIATYSYGIYLVHVPALWIAFVLGAHMPVLARWGLLGTLLVALPWIAYHGIESPGITLGQKFAFRPVPRLIDVGAP